MTREEALMEILKRRGEGDKIHYSVAYDVINEIFDDLESRTCKNCKYNFCGCSIQDMILEFKDKYGIEPLNFDDFGCNRFEKKKKEIKKNEFMIVEFLSEDTFKVLFVFDKEKAKKEYNKTFTLGESYEIGNEVTLSGIRKKYNWKDVPYNEKHKLWDGQPVFVRGNDTPFLRVVRFYSAVNNSFFYDNIGKRNVTPNLIDDEYSWEPYPHLNDEWVIKAYRQLKF